jgi:hypothetical protein
MHFFASLHRGSLTRAAFAALVMLGCSTHTVDECLPACDSTDQTEFAECVASGTSECQAGNRRCCALAQECVGSLDDQIVQTTRTECGGLVSDVCERPCTVADEAGYELCVGMGSPNCPVGDEECCALAAHCLGAIGDVLVTADGCCGDASDCGAGDICDSTWTCVEGPGCGDGIPQTSERCDDGNQYTEPCAYGMHSCAGCNAECFPIQPRYCGDGNTDSLDGEECDPPDGRTCDDTCHSIASTQCTNRSQDGEETDVDCGGPECPPCPADAMCLVDTDCQRLLPECDSFAGCDGVCYENHGCEGAGSCTGICTPGEGCSSVIADVDSDGFDCDVDCDDADRQSNPSAPEICGDFVDQNCDGTPDDHCPT